jgi:hypothetical protein
LTLDRNPAGELSISLDTFGEDGKLIARIKNNTVILNQGNYLSVERADFNSLVITDTHGLEVLNVNYLNPKAIIISGTLRASSGRLLTLDKMLRGTFCFSIPKGARVGSVFDI